MAQYPALIELSSLDGVNGFRISGEAAGDFSGGSVASAGDVNGDGFADLIIGASIADPRGTSSGAGYVVFGKASGFGAEFSLSNLALLAATSTTACTGRAGPTASMATAATTASSAARARTA